MQQCHNLKSHVGRALVGMIALQSTLVSSMPQLPVYAAQEATMCSQANQISGYGQDGPYSKAAGYDVIIEAEAGLMHMLVLDLLFFF